MGGVRLITAPHGNKSNFSREGVYQQSLQLNAISQMVPVQQELDAKALSGLVRISCSQSMRPKCAFCSYF